MSLTTDMWGSSSLFSKAETSEMRDKYEVIAKCSLSDGRVEQGVEILSNKGLIITHGAIEIYVSPVVAEVIRSALDR